MNIIFNQRIQNNRQIFIVDLFFKQTNKYYSYDDNEEDGKIRYTFPVLGKKNIAPSLYWREAVISYGSRGPQIEPVGTHQ